MRQNLARSLVNNPESSGESGEGDRKDFTESISDADTITVIEWGNSVGDLLPEHHPKITLTLKDDGSRELTLEHL